MNTILRKSCSRWQRSILAGALALAFAVLPAGAIIDATLQMQLGNPSGATADPTNHDHYLIQRPVEAIDYSDNLGQPNWASWDVTVADIGSSGRSDAWAVDTNLPPGFYQVPISPFSGSGYDRGHMCPSADRTDTVANNELVFIMSNIIPQASLQNQNIWANFENYCRQTLLPGGKELLIMCGPSLFTSSKLDSNHVTVAGYTWKIVVAVPGGAGTATNRISPTTQVVALRIPNTDAVAFDAWQNYRTNVVAIEADTGFSFLTALPPNLATVLRNKVDGQNPPAPAITGFSPASGEFNSSVTITGTNLVFATNVTFNGTSASFSIGSTTHIVATVPAGATSGLIQVQTLGGTANSSSSFTVGGTGATDLAITTTHTGNFTQGDIGDIYTIIVTNAGNAASSGAVAVVDTLPADLTATSISGAGWTTDLGTLTCTRSDALAAGAAYPSISVTVNVAANAAANVTNTITVSGGSDTNLANNAASDPTTITPAAAPTAITGTANAIGATVATLNGTVNPNGQPATVQFQYGNNTSYDSVAFLPGTVAGVTAQGVSASIKGLLAGTTYHFRVTATNVLGSSSGLDQTFATEAPGVADLGITAVHISNFNQGDTNATYTLIVTNAGAGASSGTVTVVDTLPTGLTATAISGAGWTTNLGTLTCTRADALAEGAAYPPITITVSVATNASANVTNTATVSGGGDTNLSNNTAIDPTTINPSSGGGSLVTLVGWDVNGLPGGANNYGPSPLLPTTNAAGVTVAGLTRGSGVGTNNSGAQRAWGGNNWTDASAAVAIASNRFATFSVAANSGNKVSYNAISRFDYRHSASGPTNGLLQYQIGAGVFNDIATVAYPTNANSGASLPPIDLSGIAALQDVGAGTNVTFRIVNWGGTSSGGTWYIFDVANSTALDFELRGTVSAAAILVPDLAIAMTHAGSFAQGDTNDSYTITVTNIGAASTVGQVGVTDLLPTGLIATAIGGTGWTGDLATATCTRSDALAPGASYPPIDVTVSVAIDAQANVTNTAIVSGGGENNLANNTASDPTSIILLEPIQRWRLQWFGTTADSGTAADTTIAANGMPNLLSYALGLNPLVPTNNPVVGDIDTGYLRLTVPRNPDATDISFHVELSDGLAPPSWSANGTTVVSNTPALLQVRDDAPVSGSGGGYMRLRVSRP